MFILIKCIVCVEINQYQIESPLVLSFKLETTPWTGSFEVSQNTLTENISEISSLIISPPVKFYNYTEESTRQRTGVIREEGKPSTINSTR